MKIIMLKGLPASGKSTWARERQKEGGNFLVISKDEIRKMFGGYKPSREKEHRVPLQCLYKTQSQFSHT